MGMIDISEKDRVPRVAIAKGEIELSVESIEAIKEKKVKKGDVFQVAEISAIQAVKKTPESLPHCHQIPIESIEVDFEIESTKVTIRCEVKAIYKTGVEMEALSGVKTALLSIWDMVKYIEKDDEGQYPETNISNVKIIKKEKGVEEDG